jgi:hypothetical protein
LHRLDGATKLGEDISKKIGKNSKGIRLEFKRESPKKMRAIINNSKIIFEAGYTDNRGCPQITMYQVKILGSTQHGT